MGQGLRQRGIKHIAIVSRDHEMPTRKLAQELGMDRYFAQVLPADKADYVEQLQKEGRKVCFVGDGINDAIALKKASDSPCTGARSATFHGTSVAADLPGCRSVPGAQNRGILGRLPAAGLTWPVYNADQPIAALKSAGLRTLGPP